MKYELNYWSELLKYEYLFPIIPKLGSYEVGLHLAVRPDKRAGLLDVLRACERESVPVTLWPLLSKKQGYWVNAWNLGVQEKWIAYLLRISIPFRVALDLEAPINFKGLVGRVKTQKLLTVQPPKQVRARLEMLVNHLHTQHIEVLSTSFFTNPSWNAAQGCPRPRNADAYSYMIYTSFFQRFASGDTLDNVVYWCARKIIEGHGREQGAIDLGLNSYGVVDIAHFLGLSDLNRIVSEIAVSLYAGLRRIHIFALDMITADLDAWLERTRNVCPKRPPLFSTGHQGLVYKLFKKILFKEHLALQRTNE